MSQSPATIVKLDQEDQIDDHMLMDFLAADYEIERVQASQVNAHYLSLQYEQYDSQDDGCCESAVYTNPVDEFMSTLTDEQLDDLLSNAQAKENEPAQNLIRDEILLRRDIDTELLSCQQNRDPYRWANHDDCDTHSECGDDPDNSGYADEAQCASNRDTYGFMHVQNTQRLKKHD